ncbi:hypothetical protein ABPG77_008436 [Micractinium sp. CCAP 211/92]
MAGAILAPEDGGAPSPALRQRQKRQRRITAGGKAAGAVLQAPPKPPPLNNAGGRSGPAALPLAASTSAQAEAESLETAWVDYLCAGQPAVWAFLMPTLPAYLVDLVQRHHPAAVFPSHYPHSLPPNVPQLQALEPPPATQAAPAAAAVAAPVPVLRPAGGPPLPLPVVAHAAAPPEEPPEAAIPRLVPAALHPAAAEPEADSDGSEASSIGPSDMLSEFDMLSGQGDLLSSGLSMQQCWCSECCPLGSCSYTESSDSARLQPGRRISWRGVLRAGDPVRRNLMPLMNKAAAAAAVAAAEAAAAMAATEANAAGAATAAAAAVSAMCPAAQPAVAAPEPAPPTVVPSVTGRVLRPRPHRRR